MIKGEYLTKPWWRQKSWIYELLWSTRTLHQLQEPACGRMRRRTLPLLVDSETSAAENQCCTVEAEERVMEKAQSWFFSPCEPPTHHKVTSPKRGGGCKRRHVIGDHAGKAACRLNIMNKVIHECKSCTWTIFKLKGPLQTCFETQNTF